MGRSFASEKFPSFFCIPEAQKEPPDKSANRSADKKSPNLVLKTNKYFLRPCPFS